MDVETEIATIKERNERVESDKAWETSYARRLIIAAGTYLASYLLFVLIEAPDPHLAALVPSFAYVLSTMTMPFFKKQWLKRRK